LALISIFDEHPIVDRILIASSTTTVMDLQPILPSGTQCHAYSAQQYSNLNKISGFKLFVNTLKFWPKTKNFALFDLKFDWSKYFDLKSKYKIENMTKYLLRIESKIENFFKNRKFGEKLRIWSKI